MEVAVVSKVFLPDRGEHDPQNTAAGQDCRLSGEAMTSYTQAPVLSRPAAHQLFQPSVNNRGDFIYFVLPGLLWSPVSLGWEESVPWALTAYHLAANSYILCHLFFEHINTKLKSVFCHCRVVLGSIFLNVSLWEGLKRGQCIFHWLLLVTHATEGKHRAWNLSCQLPSGTLLHWKVLQ